MPKLKLNIPPLGGWVKTPNYILDTLMPTLKDTELRTLLVILRQTAGWNRTGRPVILKYKQLIQKTGRRSEAISSALKSLERRGLIHTIRASRHHPPEFPNKRSAKSEQQQYKDM